LFGEDVTEQIALEKKDFQICQQTSIKPLKTLHCQNTTTTNWQKCPSFKTHVNEV